MRTNPLGALDIPSDWPRVGFLGGRRIDLREAWQTLSYAGLSMVEVDVPGRGRIAPWSNVGDLHFYELGPGRGDGSDGSLSRVEAEAWGIGDADLERWAKERHGIRLDLSGDDTPDTRSIRYDASCRMLADLTWRHSEGKGH